MAAIDKQLNHTVTWESVSIVVKGCVYDTYEILAAASLTWIKWKFCWACSSLKVSSDINPEWTVSFEMNFPEKTAFCS